MHHQSQRYEIRATAIGPAIPQDFWQIIRRSVEARAEASPASNGSPPVRGR